MNSKTMNAKIYNRENNAPDDGWFQIEVTGRHPAGEGREQVIDEKALTSIVNRFQAEAASDEFPGLLVDADHLSHDMANDTAALAWVKALAIRNNQLHARLELTDLGEAAVKGRRYKFFSTEYEPKDLEKLPDGGLRPLRLAGLAFTNRPNNRGGRPISNRAVNAGNLRAERLKEEKRETNKMNQIAEKLGLAADAAEADILNAITALLDKCAAMETKDAETQADAVMNRLGERVPEAVRPQWREQLIKNRAAAVKLMEASFPEVKNTERIFNRAGAKAPESVGNEDESARAARQNSVVTSIRNREKCNFQTAWNIAKGEHPELF